jgi:hypothetical protein
MAAFLYTTIPSSVSEFRISRQAASASANTLIEPRITYDYIRAFEDASYALTAPIPIQYERGQLGYTASFDEANIAISGVSKFEACRALEVEILDAFDDWSADESTLGPGPRQQFAVLKQYIRKNR